MKCFISVNNKINYFIFYSIHSSKHKHKDSKYYPQKKRLGLVNLASNIFLIPTIKRLKLP